VDPNRPQPQRAATSRRRQAQSIPGFELGELLGEGGMGRVYRALDAEGQPCALKVLRSTEVSESLQRRFDRERDIMCKLDDPRIARIFDAGITEGRQWIAMELVEGGDLGSYLDREKPDTEQIIELFLDIAGGLAIAHEAGVVHRDLKPANVMVTAEGRAKVMDFGLARDLNRETVLTQSRAVLGTPHFLAPEQAVGERDAIGPWTDVFALGVMLYQALTGKRPFDAESEADLYVQIAMTEVESPRLIDAGIPRSLAGICLRCLRKQPRRRYQNAGELAAELEIVRDGGSTGFSFDLLKANSRLLLRHHRWAIFVTAFALLALCALPFAKAALATKAAEEAALRRARRAGQLVVSKLGKLRLTLGKPQAALRVPLESLDAAIISAENLATELKSSPEGAAGLRTLRRILGAKKLQRLRSEARLNDARQRFARPEQAGSAQEALSAIAALLAQPGTPDERRQQALLLRARIHLSLGQPARAEQDIKSLSPQAQGKVEAQRLQAQFLERQGQSAAAAALLISAAASHGDHDLTLQAEAARLLDAAGKPRAADKLLAKLSRGRPSPSAMLAKARILERREHPEEALALLTQAHRRAPRDAPIRGALVATLHRRGRLAEAFQILERAAGAKPRDSAIQAERATILLERGEPQKAKKCLDDALARPTQGPRRLSLQILAIRALLSADQRPQARKELRAFLGLHPRHLSALRLELAIAPPEQRQAAAARLPVADPARIRAEISRLLAKLDFAGARRLLSKLSEADPTRPRFEAAVLQGEGHSEAAEAAYIALSTARRLSIAQGRGRLGQVDRLLIFRGKTARKRARCLLRLVLLDAPQDPQALWRLASLDQNPRRARRSISNALKLNPFMPDAVFAFFSASRRSKQALAPDLVETITRHALRITTPPSERQSLLQNRCRALIALRRFTRAQDQLAALEELCGHSQWILRLELAKAAHRMPELRKALQQSRAERQLIESHVKRLSVLLDPRTTIQERKVESPKLRAALVTLEQLVKLKPLDPRLQTLFYRACLNNALGFLCTVMTGRMTLRSPGRIRWHLEFVQDTSFFTPAERAPTMLAASKQRLSISLPERAFIIACYELVMARDESTRAGRMARARRALERIEECLTNGSRSLTIQLIRGWALLLLERKEAGEELLDLCAESAPPSLAKLMRALAALGQGNKTAALDRIEEAVEAGLETVTLRNLTLLKPLWTDPRYKRLTSQRR